MNDNEFKRNLLSDFSPSKACKQLFGKKFTAPLFSALLVTVPVILPKFRHL
jgi:hypothetical protein